MILMSSWHLTGLETPRHCTVSPSVTWALGGAEQGDGSEQVVRVADICSDRPRHEDTQSSVRYTYFIMLLHSFFDFNADFTDLFNETLSVLFWF